MIRLLFGTLVFIGFIYMVVFCGINLVLGCETWDESLWTEQNSCVKFSQMFVL